jgi:hypothetical protein
VSTDPTLDDLVFTARDDLVVETIDGECLVLDLDRNVYFGLNPVGLSIWEAISSGATLANILDGLTARFPDVPADRLDADLRAFLGQLVGAHLVLTSSP